MAVTGILGTAHTVQVLVLISAPALLVYRTGTECSVERIFFMLCLYHVIFHAVNGEHSKFAYGKFEPECFLGLDIYLSWLVGVANRPIA